MQSNDDNIYTTDGTLTEVSDDAIKVGDVVAVNFNNSEMTLCYKAVVKEMPYEVGDYWIFLDLQTNYLHYVSEGVTVSKSVSKLIPKKGG